MRAFLICPYIQTFRRSLLKSLYFKSCPENNCKNICMVFLYCFTLIHV